MTPNRRRLFQGLVTVLALTAIVRVGVFFLEFGSLAEDLGAAAWLVIANDLVSPRGIAAE